MGADNRRMDVLFTPEHEMLVQYADPARPLRETVLNEIRGSYGTQLFSSIWKQERAEP